MPTPKYRSKFEKAYAEANPDLIYEPFKLSYTLPPKSYTPDFAYRIDDDRVGIIETKGRFRTSAEASKYIAIVRDNPSYQFSFVFMKADTPMPGSYTRKDGTRLTMGQWADKHGFKWTEFKT